MDGILTNVVILIIAKMGGFFSSMWGKVFKSNKTFNILILGLANAGKTTLLYQMYLSLTQVIGKSC